MALLAAALLGTAPACSAGQFGDSARPQAPQTQTAYAPPQAAPTAAPAPTGGGPGFKESPTEAGRDVVKTASMTLTTADTTAAADKAVSITTGAGGRVDSRSEDAGSRSGRAHISLVLRVPIAELDDTLDEFEKLGTVDTVEIRAEDVTAQRVDLDARITALQTSVDRLLGIMRDAKDPDALIKAEGALSQRQADLDSLRAQRTQLGDQIDYSTVDLDVIAEGVGGPTKQYHGFTGQIERGWDALVAVASGAVMLFGLFLPWLGVLAVVIVVLFAAVWVVRSRRG